MNFLNIWKVLRFHVTFRYLVDVIVLADVPCLHVSAYVLRIPNICDLSHQ